MQDKTLSRIKKSLSVFVLLLVIVVAGGLFKINNKSSAADPLPSHKTTGSVFSFNAAQAPTWRKGPSNHTSLALFYDKSDCFVSFEIKPGTVDENVEVQKIQSSMESQGYTVTNTANPSVTLQQSGTKTDYVLHQYSVTGVDSSDAVYKSQEYAYIPTTSGYVFVQGYCDDPANLPGTVAALSAVTFKP